MSCVRRSCKYVYLTVVYFHWAWC